MKIYNTLLIFTLFSSSLFAQDMQLLSTISKEAFRFTAINQKEINQKWDYFGNSSIAALYKPNGTYNIELTHLANRKIYKNVVNSIGLSYDNGDLMPEIGLGFSKEKDRLSIGFYPTVNYALKAKEWGTGLNSVIEYSPTLNENWHFFSLLLLDVDYEFSGEVSSSQFLNLGMGHKKGVQFGLSFDFSQDDNFKDNSLDPGIFVGFSF